MSRVELPKLVKNPAAYFLEYRDGLKATLLMLNGAVKDFTFAARVKGAGVQSTQFFLSPEPNVTYSACLVSKIEELFETGKAPYPVERTLLVSGVLESCLTSRFEGKKRLRRRTWICSIGAAAIAARRRSGEIMSSSSSRPIGLSSCSSPASGPRVAPGSDRALAAHRDALVFDAHVHASSIVSSIMAATWVNASTMGSSIWCARERRRPDAMFFSLFVTEQCYPARLETNKHWLIDAAYEQLAKNKDKIELALNASDVERITQSGRSPPSWTSKAASIWTAISRSFGISIGSGCARSSCPPTTGPTTSPIRAARQRKWHGLNDRGRAVIHEANRLGMVINISHGSDETISAGDRRQQRPHPRATHHGLRSFNDIPARADDLVRKLAAKGGA